MFRNHNDVYRPPCGKKNESSATFDCDICTEGGWASETEVEIHKNKTHRPILAHMRSDLSKFVCLVCTKEQEDEKNLIKHIISEHLLSSEDAVRVQRKLFICDCCSQIFFNKTLLECHISKKHDQHTNRMVNCPKCMKRVNTLQLWHHMEHHRLQSICLCPICLDKCLNRGELKEHLNNHLKYFCCDICRYETKKESLFNEHIEKHKLKNPSQSDIDVDKYFVPVPSNKKKHFSKSFIQYAIKGLTLYKLRICILCREICMSKEEMKRHLLCDHSPEEQTQKKNYSCICGEQFSNNVLLKQHTLKEKGHKPLVEGETSTFPQIYIIEYECEGANETIEET